MDTMKYFCVVCNAELKVHDREEEIGPNDELEVCVTPCESCLHEAASDARKDQRVIVKTAEAQCSTLTDKVRRMVEHMNEVYRGLH